MSTLDDVFAALAAWRQPSPSSDPFNLSCRVQPGASMEDLEAAGFVGSVPDELITLWTASRESWLFEDTEHGQWGLHLLSPGDCAARTSVERASRQGDIRSTISFWESFAVTRTCLSIPVRRCPCAAFLLRCHWIRETSGYQLVGR